MADGTAAPRPPLAPAARDFLNMRFPHLGIAPPLVTGWPVSVRFDLTSGRADPRARLNEVTARAETLFAASFAEADSGFVLAYSWLGEPDATGDYFISLLRRTPSAEPELRRGVNFYGAEEATDRIPYLELWLPVIPASLPVKELLRGIAARELGEAPSVHWRVFLVNTSVPRVFHMYDDRGLDVIAADARALEPLNKVSI